MMACICLCLKWPPDGAAHRGYYRGYSKFFAFCQRRRLLRNKQMNSAHYHYEYTRQAYSSREAASCQGSMSIEQGPLGYDPIWRALTKIIVVKIFLRLFIVKVVYFPNVFITKKRCVL